MEIQEQYKHKAFCWVRAEETETTSYLKIMGENLKALLGAVSESKQDMNLDSVDRRQDEGGAEEIQYRA